MLLKNSTNYVVDPTSTDKSKASYKYPKNTVEYWAKDTYDDFYKTHNAGKTHTFSKSTKATGSAKVYNPETAFYILDYVKRIPLSIIMNNMQQGLSLRVSIMI